MKNKLFVALLLVSLFTVNAFAFAASASFNTSLPPYGGGTGEIAVATRDSNLANASINVVTNQYGEPFLCAVRNRVLFTGANGVGISANTLVTATAYSSPSGTGTLKMAYLANARVASNYSTVLRGQGTAAGTGQPPTAGSSITGTYDADVN